MTKPYGSYFKRCRDCGLCMEWLINIVLYVFICIQSHFICQRRGSVMKLKDFITPPTLFCTLRQRMLDELGDWTDNSCSDRAVVWVIFRLRMNIQGVGKKGDATKLLTTYADIASVTLII